MEGKYLITTDAWFYAPDGKMYRSVWGSVEIVDDSILGLKTNRMSTNWFAKVGSDKNHVLVAGCQIHYAVKCNHIPNLDSIEDIEVDSLSDNKIIMRPSAIYNAE